MTKEQDRQRAFEFGVYLDAAMDAAGITQAQLARKIGISESMISRWRRGAVPEMEGLRALAHALDKEPMELFIRAGRVLPEEAGYTAMPEAPRPPSVEEAIAADPLMSKRGKEAFLLIYRQFEERIAAEREAEQAEADQSRRQRRGA